MPPRFLRAHHRPLCIPNGQTTFELRNLKRKENMIGNAESRREKKRAHEVVRRLANINRSTYHEPDALYLRIELSPDSPSSPAKCAVMGTVLATRRGCGLLEDRGTSWRWLVGWLVVCFGASISRNEMKTTKVQYCNQYCIRQGPYLSCKHKDTSIPVRRKSGTLVDTGAWARAGARTRTCSSTSSHLLINSGSLL